MLRPRPHVKGGFHRIGEEDGRIIDGRIISKNPKIRIASLAQTFTCKLFVFDASNPAWKIEKWKEECKSLNLSWYSVSETGAFIYNIGI